MRRNRTNVRKWFVYALAAVSVGVSSPALAKPVVSLIGPFGGWGESLQQAMNVFAARNGVEAALIVTASWQETWDKVATMTAAGAAPDVLYGDNSTLHFYALNNLSQPLDRFANVDTNLQRYPTTVLDVFRLGGQLYALPTALSIHHTYYNVDLFNQAGLGPLPVQWNSDAFTWDEFVALLKKLTVDTNGDGRPDQFGSQSFGWAGGWNHVGLWNGHFIDYDATEFYGDSAQVIAALERTTSLWT